MVKKETYILFFEILVGLFLFVNIFLLNVIMHESGHYIAANYFDLKPEMEFHFIESIGELNFSLNSIKIASTSFFESNNDEMRVIALMGPFMNLILSVLFLITIIFSDNKIKEFGIMGTIISLVSFLMNILPFEGTDGSLILNLGG